MKRFRVFGRVLPLVFLALLFVPQAFAQRGEREVYTGTVLSYGTGFNTRTVTRPFTLTINGATSDSQAQGFLTTLQEGGQDNLLKDIKGEDLGYFSVGAQLGRRLNVVRESVTDGQRRIFIVFERWTQFAEVRGGYRSLDYPFGVIELMIDERTGKGEGTYIAAARIRWTRDRKSNEYQVEVENFATFPARLLAVTRSRRGRQ
jgi:hypothetical protein